MIKIPVGYTEEVKTLYYAVKKGNLHALKLIRDVAENIKVYTFDLGV